MTAPVETEYETAGLVPRQVVSDRRGSGYRVNPLAKIAVTAPPMVLLLFTRDIFTPLVCTVLSLAVVVAVVRPRPLRLAVVTVLAVVAFAWAVLVFALSAAPEISAGTPIVARWGPLVLHAGAVEYGTATVLRVASLVALACLGGVGTTATHLVSALVTQLRIPYRFAFVALTSLRLLPRLRREAAIINAAHRVRGVREPRGPIGGLVRARRMLLPLMAGGIRHAERMSLAMDARGFGAHTIRRDRDPARFTWQDSLIVLLGLAIWGGVVWMSATLGHLEVVASVY